MGVPFFVAQDMALQPARDGCVLDCFIVERMHLTIKSVADNVKNTSAFERSVLTAHCIAARRLKAETEGINRLLGGVQAWPGLPHVAVSNRLRCLALQVQRTQTCSPPM
jgi:hypothetical protein